MSPDAQTLIYARELAQLQRLRRAYERLLPEALDPSRAAAGDAVVRTATVLFTDLRGFTRLAEHLADEPQTLLAIVNAHLAVAAEAILRCAGVVEKFLGDGIMATFGARAEMPDHHQRALAAALAVVGANETANLRRAASHFRLEVGVGVAAGKVVVGQIGPPARSELGILGDPVNVAARLVANAAPGEILLAASAYRALGASVRADLLGRQAVRGRASRLDVYRIALLRKKT